MADIRPFDISPMSAFGPQKKPKVQINRQKTSLGWAYRIYINGHYMGTGLTQASAREGAKRMLAIYERQQRPPVEAHTEKLHHWLCRPGGQSDEI